MTDSKDDRIRALEEEVRRLSMMLESAPDFISRITVDGKFLYINRVAPGFDRNAVVGTSIDDYVPAEHRARAWQAIARASETGVVQQYDNVGRVSIDRLGHYLTRVSPVLEGGEVTSMVMIATDVTELQESRTLLQVALDATGLGIWTMEPDGTGSWDETTRRIFGVYEDVPSPDLGGMIAQCIYEADRPRVSAGIEQALTGKGYGPLEHRIVHPNGEMHWVSASGITVRDHEGKFVRLVGSVQDITHRRVLEARLLEAQKLESIGRLAGGVAHDFNNMLTAILGNVDLASTARDLDEVAPILAEVRLVAERSAALTAQLLAFARRQVIEPKVVDLNALIVRTNAILRRVLGEHIALSVDLRSTCCVRVDASQLEQVILNLATNARDSMPRGGRLELRTNDVELTDQHVPGQFDVARGPYVRISIADTGTGIAPELLPQIFEPFFTTRQGGTGLGLATCYGIVKQSGGHITVQSEPGNGTTFTVFLPRVESAEAACATPAPPVAAPRTGERVLVVEDEPAVRSVLERTLTLAGYRVVVAHNGVEGVRVANEQGPFDLLVTDAVMPGMSGWEVGKVLGARWPELKILYISGYSEDAVVHGGELDPELQFLQKPFSPGQLLDVLRRILDGASRDRAR